MSFEDLYKALDEINVQDKKEKCCDNVDNHSLEEEVIICKLCGKFINNIINSPEWRYYGSEDSKRGDPTRCGMPVNLLLPKSSIGTSINNKGNFRDRLSTRQRWNSMPYKERSKYKIFIDIESRCNTNNLPIIISETAKSLYSVISETKISRGKNRKGIIAACVFNACKECKVPRSIKEISKIFDLESKVLTKGCKLYTEITRLNKSNVNRFQQLDTIKVEDFIDRFSFNLSISDNDNKIIKNISKLASNLELMRDNTPPAMATGCIYLFIKLKGIDISKQTISNKCNISEVTINKCYKKLEESKELIEVIHNKYEFTK